MYNHHPVLVMRLDLQELTETPSSDIPGFVDRLVELLPGLREHQCSRGYPGGFVERLHEGTYPAHIVEHVSLELSQMAGIPVGFGKARWAGPAESLYNVIVRFRSERGMRHLLETAVELVEALIAGNDFPLEECLAANRRLVAEHELGPSTRAIVDAAERRGIPWVRVDEDSSLVQLGWGRHRRYIRAALTDRTSNVGVDIAGDKDLAKKLLDRASIPVPRGVVVTNAEEARSALASLGAPVVVKPLDGRQGHGVSLGLETEEEVTAAFEIASDFSSDVLVEEQFTGRNYRVLVVDGVMIAAAERVPCHVVGDGAHTLQELIEIANADPRRGEGHEKPLTTIKVDPLLMAHLRKEGISLEDVPGEGKQVMLCAGMNLSTGGTARDVTDRVHPSYRSLCERAADTAGLDICGVDLVAEDISRPYHAGHGGIIELNAAPGLRMHLYPDEGTPRDVGGAIIDMLYPRDSNGRIPVTSITGTNGKTTVTRMIDHILRGTGLAVGTTTTDGIYFNGERVYKGDTTGPISAATVLANPRVEAAVLETARGGIVRRGLAFDWCDVGVMTTIQPDHIGQDGIESVEDILDIKSLVAERVRLGGTLVLNADDEMLMRLPEEPRILRVEKRIVLFSLDPDNARVARHLADGGTAFIVERGMIVEAAGNERTEIVNIDELPATLGGLARFQVANALAASAACRAHGLAPEAIADGLRAFGTEEHNPGRLNLFRVGHGYVLVDYGHNPDAIGEIARIAKLWGNRRSTVLLGVPGDRADSVVIAAAKAAAGGFDRYVIKEDRDLRGRRPGEVAEILRATIEREVPVRECTVVLSEIEALSRAIAEMEPGEVVVVFYDKIEPVMDLLERHEARRVTSLDGVDSDRELAGV